MTALLVDDGSTGYKIRAIMPIDALLYIASTILDYNILFGPREVCKRKTIRKYSMQAGSES